ncbi:MAG: outer membrane protein transport protein [Geminicoccaceae bacterium]|jgi:long-chain fatty acid transport protein|nr:outer membrane protein transport protein [Geminicoccaceae bacterium]MCB9966068.1 outer membrane protein transport protein [Geminicoccaceae bacterium]HRY24518.1 outer membrane protein transport protein [Geminicoccaceae bacterium]
MLQRTSWAWVSGAFLVGLAAGGPAEAGGLYISEFATPSMGTASAGAQAWADNASTALHNPAGMTRLEGSALMVGAGFGLTEVKFDPDRSAIQGNDGGDAGTLAPLATLAGVLELDERWAVGLSAGGITGAALEYDDDWVGRFQVTDVSLVVAGITPSVAYAVTDRLSLGVGATLWYANLNETIRPSAVGGNARVRVEDADDTDVTFNLSALFELTDDTRFGVIYNSEAKLNLSGDVDVRPLGQQASAGLDFTFPQYVKASVYHDLSDSVALLGSVRWEDWSAFGDIPVSADRGSTAIPANWRDTYGFSLGVHYRPVDDLLLQAGFGYDTSPVSDRNRRADLPVDRQYRYSVGAQYAVSERVTVGGSLVYADLGDADIDADLFGGSYKENRALFFALNLGYRF